MKGSFPYFRTFSGAVIGGAVLLMASCSPQATSSQAGTSSQAAFPQANAPQPPQPAGDNAVPSTPDSASNIMRIADIDFASYSRNLAKTVGLEIGETMPTATLKLESHFAPKGGSIEDAAISVITESTETEFSTFGAEGGKVTLVERINIRDDSVKAEQFYAIFKSKDDGYMLVDYGLKIKCQRGDNTTEWQTKLCP